MWLFQIIHVDSLFNWHVVGWRRIPPNQIRGKLCPKDRWIVYLIITWWVRVGFLQTELKVNYFLLQIWLAKSLTRRFKKKKSPSVNHHINIFSFLLHFSISLAQKPSIPAQLYCPKNRVGFHSTPHKACVYVVKFQGTVPQIFEFP